MNKFYFDPLNIINGREVSCFFKQFILPPRIACSVPNGFPTNIETVLRDVHAVWDRKGLITPAELRAELLEKYYRQTPNTPPEFIAFLRSVELSRNKPEQVTQYLDKQHAYLAAGLNHYFAVSRHQQVLAIGCDFSNMGGTNIEFRQRIANERGVSIHDVPEHAYMYATDRAVQALSLGMVHDLKEHYPGIDLHAIRTGGDEVQLFMRMNNGDVITQETQNQIADMLHAGIEERVARLGLQDHPHLKNPGNVKRKGFGAAVAVVDFSEIKDQEAVTHWIQGVDAKIECAKMIIGALRLGEIDEQCVRKEIECRISAGKLSVPPNTNNEYFICAQLERVRESAIKTAEELRRINPINNHEPYTMASYFDRVEGMLAQFEGTKTPTAHVPDAVAPPVPIGAHRPADVPVFAPLSQRRFLASLGYLVGLMDNHDIHGVHLYGLRQTVHMMTPMDASSQTQMPGDMMRVIEAHAAEIGEFRENIGAQLDSPDIQGAFEKARIHSVEALKPFGLSYSLHGLASLNHLLGHHGADLALRELGKNLLIKSFLDAGIPFDARHPLTIAHHGGGNFSMVLSPVMYDRNGKPIFISEAMVNDAEERMQANIAEYNALSIVDAMEKMGVILDHDEVRKLHKKGIYRLREIPDSKMRKTRDAQGHEVEGYVRGILAVSKRMEIPADIHLDGSVFLSHLRVQADQHLNALRCEQIRAQHDLVLNGRQKRGQESFLVERRSGLPRGLMRGLGRVAALALVWSLAMPSSFPRNFLSLTIDFKTMVQPRGAVARYEKLLPNFRRPREEFFRQNPLAVKTRRETVVKTALLPREL